MGTAQDLAPGKRNPAVVAEGGEKMTGAEVDAIKEAADAMAWEEFNREDPKAQAAVSILKVARSGVAQAVLLLCKAAEMVEDTPETHRIDSLANDLEDLGCAIGAQVERMK